MQTQRSAMISFILITTLFVVLLLAFIVLILFLYQLRQFKYQKKIEILKADFNDTLLATQFEIQEQTFESVSREIHDNIGLSLTLVKLQLNTIDWQNLLKSQEQVNCSIHAISQAIDGLRYISKTLHTDFISEQGLINALDHEITNIRVTGMFNVQFKIIGTPIYLDTKKELVVFRMIQESLNNSIKHSGAKELGLFLHYSNSGLKIEISDNGKGFNQDEQKQKGLIGTGLTNLAKRAKHIDSTCIITSQPGNGTIVQIDIPLLNKD
jgi:signal transduction histidine kinase